MEAGAAGLTLPGVSPFRPGEDFRRWLKGVERYLTAVNIATPERQCAVLLHLLGPDVADTFETLPEPEGAEQDNAFEKCKKKLDAYLAPARNVIAERMSFHQMTMGDNEDFEHFLGRLSVKLRQCGYPAAETDRELRDRCVAGCSGALRERLFRKAAARGDALTLADVRAVARAHKDAGQLAEQMTGGGASLAASGARAEEALPVQALRQRPATVRPPPGRCYRCGEAGHWQRNCPAARAGPPGPRPTAQPGGGDRNCGNGRLAARDRGDPQERGSRDAPFGPRVKRCFKCGDPGHLKRDCPRRGQVASVEEDVVMTVAPVQSRKPDRLPMVTVSINGRPVRMLVDTGSPVSILTADCLPGLKLRRSELRLKSFTGQAVPVRGEATVDVECNGQRRRLDAVVSDQPGHQPILGRDWLREIRLDWQSVLRIGREGEVRTVEAVMAAHSAVFSEDLGKMTLQAHLTLKPGATPRRLPPRPVPYALLPQVEAELERWVSEGIARKVSPSEESSGWGTPLVPVPKSSGGVRLCASYNLTVNPQLIVKNHPLPTPEDVFAGVRGKLFCKLDLRHAYQQMELDESSQAMTTVSTHRGEYVMRRLAFGIASSGALFQEAMDRILEGQEGCKCFLDDLLVFGEDEQELLQRLDQVLERLERHGLRLASQKCKLMVPEVEFIGWKVTPDGITPTDSGIEAVLNAPEPKDVSQLRSLLGSITYFGRLLPDLSTVLAPLYELVKKGVPWSWTQRCAAAVKKVKSMLTSPPVLKRYDPALPLKLVTDASSVGVGAALMQVMPDGAERPVMFASRTLTATERKYAQVEREAAAVSFGVSRFHRFIFGRQFTLVVDNRALSRILSPDRNLPSLAAARLQRYALQLAAYSYSVELRRSEQMHVADTLSRLAVPCTSSEQGRIDADEVAGSYLMLLDGVAPALTAEALKTATRRDPVLAKVLTFVRCGWPSNVEPELSAFKRRQDELTTDGECLVWGGRVVIPQRLRAAVLSELHGGHLGSSKMKNLARRYVWWPGLDAELDGLARDCADCVEKRGAPAHSELHPWEPAGGPWERLHVDFAGPFQGSTFFVVYDSFTKWLEVVPMRETGTESTVRELRALFARFGIPGQLVSDNGPQFTSAQFAEFLASNGVRHVRVAPYHPSSNGAAERAVQTAKNGLKAALRDGGSLSRRLQRFLLAYRAAPHATTGRSPAEMMLGRNVRTRLDLLRPGPAERSREQQQRQWSAAGGQPRTFNIGDAVWARHYGGPQKWRRGTVAARTGPVSYEVEVGDTLWSRHADQLLAAGAAKETGAEPTGGETPGGGGSSGEEALWSSHRRLAGAATTAGPESTGGGAYSGGGAVIGGAGGSGAGGSGAGGAELAEAEPAAAEPAAAGPAAAEPVAAEPAAAEPAGAESAGAEPAGTEPAAAEPAVTEPVVLRPALTMESVGARVKAAVRRRHRTVTGQCGIPTPLPCAVRSDSLCRPGGLWRKCNYCTYFPVRGESVVGTYLPVRGGECGIAVCGIQFGRTGKWRCPADSATVIVRRVFARTAWSLVVPSGRQCRARSEVCVEDGGLRVSGVHCAFA